MRKSFPPCTQGCARALLASHGRRATAGSSGGNVQRLANLLTPTTLTRSHAPRSARHPTQVSAEAQALAEAQAPAEAPALAEASALATAQTLPAHTPVECCAWRSRLTRRSSVAHGAPGSHAGRVLRMALPAHTPAECCAWRSRLTRRSSVAHGAPGSHAGRVLREDAEFGLCARNSARR
jgi:hypothetical protein